MYTKHLSAVLIGVSTQLSGNSNFYCYYSQWYFFFVFKNVNATPWPSKPAISPDGLTEELAHAPASTPARSALGSILRYLLG